MFMGRFNLSIQLYTHICPFFFSKNIPVYLGPFQYQEIPIYFKILDTLMKAKHITKCI